MEKAEEKRCADAVTTVLVEFLGRPLSLLLCIKQICKYSRSGQRQQHPLEASLQQSLLLWLFFAHVFFPPSFCVSFLPL